MTVISVNWTSDGTGLGRASLQSCDTVTQKLGKSKVTLVAPVCNWH